LSANRKWVDAQVKKSQAGPSSNYFETPDFFFQKYNKIYNFQFDLSANKSNKKCERFFSEQDDSLKQDWHKINGWLWLNPPYSPLKPWIQKAQQEFKKGAQIVVLIPPIMNTRYFKEVLPTKIIMVVGRIPFLNPDKVPMRGNSHDSCLVVYDGQEKPTPRIEWIER
jgi:site-specific DNA-methyltransferase (adenine-specific)